MAAPLDPTGVPEENTNSARAERAQMVLADYGGDSLALLADIAALVEAQGGNWRSLTQVAHQWVLEGQGRSPTRKTP